MKLSPFWIWAIAPTAFSLAVIGFVAFPNYQTASTMRADSSQLSHATDQYLVQRDEFDRLGVELNGLRSQRDESGHTVRHDVNESKLISSLTRPIDGTDVLDQSIRIGDRTKLSVQPAGLSLDHRAIEMEMTGSFDAVFLAVRTAESEAGMTRVRLIDIRRNGPQVQVNVGIDEFFHSSEDKQ